jgi:hypothetical protein
MLGVAQTVLLSGADLQSVPSNLLGSGLFFFEQIIKVYTSSL